MDSLGASSSNQLVMLTKCEICNSPAHGKHFGAFTCRACAAFFRRFGNKPLDDVICRKESSKCDSMNQKRHACKKCRLQRCYDAGMSSKLFQFHRDLISSTKYRLPNIVIFNEINKNLPNSLELFVGRPHFLIMCEPEKQSPIKEIIDVQFLINKAMEVINNGPTFPPPNNLNSLEKLVYGIKISKDGFRSLYKIEKFCKQASLCIWENEFLNSTKMLLYIDDFRRLKNTQKLEIIKSTWVIWSRLDKYYQIAQSMRTTTHSPGIVNVTHNCLLDMKNYEIDLSWFTKYNKEQLAFFLDFRSESFINEMTQPIINLNPTETEIAFMLSYVCFHFAGKQLSPEMREITDAIENTLTNNLHDYYNKNNYLPNYASRLTTMMKINNNLINSFLQRRKKTELSRIFDLYFLSTSDPNMFIDTGF